MAHLFHPDSFRYALALWLATVLALLIAFVLQLEPAQWVCITVWIMFIQSPRLNYSKLIWWSFGTIVGAAVAVFLTVCFSQTPELLLLFLALWLAGCAGVAPLVTSYRAYGAVLAGYTCCIVTMSAVDHPDLIFQIAATRVSCIFIGIASAVLFISLLLPKHRHWADTRHQLSGHLKATLLQAANGLNPNANGSGDFNWRHMVDRLSTLEHTLDITTAESADARIHAPPAHSLVATLFDLLAKAQAIEIHLSRPHAVRPSAEIETLLRRGQTLLAEFATTISVAEKNPVTRLVNEIELLRNEVAVARPTVSNAAADELISNRFLLHRLEEVLEEFIYAVQDWQGLFGVWTARRESHLAVHRDYRSACIYALRMFLAMGLVSALWFITEWPSGAQVVLLTGVVCSLLSLVEDATLMGAPFLKSAVFCAIVAYVEAFWLLPKSETFPVLALMLGLFLLPAAYAYRHPRLIGGAVVSMLIFYGLAMPANQMNYDIAAFLNNGLALLCAATCGFFAFHAVPSLTAKARQFWLLHAVRSDLAQIHSELRFEQSWTSRMFDRLRLLHRAAGHEMKTSDWLEAENEMLVSLQFGLRQRRLRAWLEAETMTAEAAVLVADVLRECREITRHPGVVALFLRSTYLRLEEASRSDGKLSANAAGVLAEMWEMTHLLETTARIYTK